MNLKDRLSAVVDILKESNKRIEDSREAEETGFLAFKPEKLAEAVLVLSETVPGRAKVLDFGCGNGQFALLAAAAGFPSYGIEIHGRLVEEARYLHKLCVDRKLINEKVPCIFVVGDMIYPEYREEYRKFKEAHNENDSSMPISEETDDPYQMLGASARTADIIYTWSWPTQSRFLYNYLQRIAKKDAIFILPSYERYTQGEHMNAMLKERNRLILKPIAHVQDIFIGIRVEN
jgi:SAM-dependent methyltransferase